MTAENPSAYDDVPYPSYVYAQSHPDRLATLATLFGMTPVPIEECRVLELGCGAGGNIIPVAFDLCHSSFFGIDLSGMAIRQGQEMIRSLGLQNISLHHADLMTVGDLGEFDYIIAHGLFSWVSDIVRERILAICSHLAPQGVAYISYNAYPGCRLREIVRDIMRFHTKDSQDAAERVRQGRAVIKWIAEAQQRECSYATFLQEMNNKLLKRDDGSIYHDDLAETNVPLYFHEFAKHASKHGLQFLSEADFFEHSIDLGLTEDARNQLRQLGEEDVLAMEQYLDFLKGRSFRQTLLCHQEVGLSRGIDSARLKNLLIRSQLKPVSDAPHMAPGVAEEFRSKRGASATTNQPLLKAAFCYLSQIHPRAVGLAELVAQARLATDSTNTTIDDDTASLADMLLKTYEAGGVELHIHEPAYTIEPTEFPVASPIARLQLNQGNVVTTLLHDTVRFEDDLATRLLSLLDGSRDRATLAKELTEILEPISTKKTADESIDESIAAQLDSKLFELGKLGLLLA